METATTTQWHTRLVYIPRDDRDEGRELEQRGGPQRHVRLTSQPISPEHRRATESTAQTAGPPVSPVRARGTQQVAQHHPRAASVPAPPPPAPTPRKPQVHAPEGLTVAEPGAPAGLERPSNHPPASSLSDRPIDKIVRSTIHPCLTGRYIERPWHFDDPFLVHAVTSTGIDDPSRPVHNRPTISPAQPILRRAGYCPICDKHEDTRLRRFIKNATWLALGGMRVRDAECAHEMAARTGARPETPVDAELPMHIWAPGRVSICLIRLASDAADTEEQPPADMALEAAVLMGPLRELRWRYVPDYFGLLGIALRPPSGMWETGWMGVAVPWGDAIQPQNRRALREWLLACYVKFHDLGVLHGRVSWSNVRDGENGITVVDWRAATIRGSHTNKEWKHLCVDEIDEVEQLFMPSKIHS